jgi:hypothetical protein
MNSWDEDQNKVKKYMNSKNCAKFLWFFPKPRDLQGTVIYFYTQILFVYEAYMLKVEM